MAQRRIQALSDDQLHSDWTAWVKRVYDETVNLAWNRRVFREIARVFEHNPHLQETGGFLWDWIRQNYIAGAAMTLRRELDEQAGTENLRNLLSEIEARPRVIDRRRYYTQWEPLEHDFHDTLRQRVFERLNPVRISDDRMDDHLDPAMVRSDREELSRQTAIVHDYIEQTIAHRAPTGARVVTMAEFNAAIDAGVPIFQKYYALLTLSSVTQVEPVAQFNTHEPFTFPWDVTCCNMWHEFMNGRHLDWGRINAVYESGRSED